MTLSPDEAYHLALKLQKPRVKVVQCTRKEHICSACNYPIPEGHMAVVIIHPKYGIETTTRKLLEGTKIHELQFSSYYHFSPDVPLEKYLTSTSANLRAIACAKVSGYKVSERGK
jgi:hypothetical protein